MPPSRLLALLFGFVALGSPSLWGQVDHGFQAGAGFPQGDFGERTGEQMGYSLGYHQVRDMVNGCFLRPRLDVLGFQGVQRSGPAALHNRFTLITAGLESVYAPEENPHRGVYLFGGFGGASTRLVSSVEGKPAEATSPWPASGTLRETANKLYYSMGLGFQFDERFGAELRYFSTRWSGGGQNLRVSQISAQVTIRL